MKRKQEEIDEMFMRRCLQLAHNGQQLAKPNPMVGAVIVNDDNKIIGEGYHVCYGQGHAEVNAFASVKPQDESSLRQSTIYVSLEPCSHYGKTPPCADLIISKGVRRVVCGCIDPFAAVKGRGIEKLRDAGIEVTVGVLEKECLDLNKRFITFNTQQRPYIILKWAQTANGFMGNASAQRIADHLKDKSIHLPQPLAISTAFTKMLVHKLRAENDAILVGHRTELLEHPKLTVREWNGPQPQKLVLTSETSIHNILYQLYEQKAQSLIVEGGAQTLSAFFTADLWDEIRVETAPFTISDGVKAPELPPNLFVVSKQEFVNTIITYRHLD